jgi:uncharacterized iron-regulated protein
MIKKLLLFCIFLSPTFACHIEINASIEPEKHHLIATINGTKQIDKILPKQINTHFIHLLGDWFPIPTTLCTYSLHLTLPKNFIAITESDNRWVEKASQTNTTHFSLSHPISRLNIIASDDFKVTNHRYHDSIISTYFFNHHSALSQDYINQTIADIQKYEVLFGTFPYKHFSIVENHFQTGYSMPTFTLIGDKIIDKPFLLRTSLGHEILHQWFGNSLFNEYQKGNWVEGLTTYLSDHYYHDSPKTYRKNILHEYALYVDKNSTNPLSSFTHSSDKKSAVIGYGKGAFAFHMLRKRIGDKCFFTTLRAFYETYRFKKASYHDIEYFFSKKSGKDLRSLFHFLFEKTTPLTIQVSDIQTIYHDTNHYQLNFNIKSSESNLTLPLTYTIDNKSYQCNIENNTSISVLLNHRPKSLTIDPNYDLFRQLSQDETLHTLAEVVAKDTNIFTKTAILPTKKEGFFVHVENNGTLIMHQSEPKQSQGMQHRLPHYGAYKSLHFIDGKLISKHKPSSQNGINIYLQKKDENLTKILENLPDSRLIFIGEHHDNFAHHLNQLHIIQALYAKNHNIAIGMEMFQRRFQPILDAYIKKEMPQASFLKKSEYFSRWGYNYFLYKPIIDFAKAHHIPIIALNLEKEITKKISKTGLLSLNKKQKQSLPQSLDFSDRAYQARLNEIFNYPEHFASLPPSHRPDPIHLYQAQILWDETMAKTTADYLKTHPKTIMIVLAGNGHLEYSVGIPDRVKRRIDINKTVILQDIDFKKDIADIILHPSPISTTPAPKLGVYLEDKSLKVEKVITHSLASQYHVHVGDVLTKLGKYSLKKLADLKLALYHYHDKEVSLEVRRNKKTISLTREKP